jgi:hypothetical protein
MSKLMISALPCVSARSSRSDPRSIDEPEGFLELAGDGLGIPSGQVEEDLERFRDFIEQTGRETGGWRGRIGEGLDSTAGAVRQEAAQGVEAVNERVHPEIVPEEAGIGTDRSRGEQGESFQTREHPFELANDHQHNKAGTTKPSDEQIARRAYELYLDRGQSPGHELEDWLKAEWELSENWGQ